MITLKLATYSQHEIDTLAELLRQLQPTLNQNCLPQRECRACPVRHLCVDIAQATLFAEETVSVRN